MIDLHCHLLPGIDDGAQTPEDSVAMARLAQESGTTLLACTPHIYPGLFPNTRETIEAAKVELRKALDEAGIDLPLVFGADIQIVPDLLAKLRSGELPTLNGGRYFLFEPPHHVHAPEMLDLIHSTLAGGFVPVITHPERLNYAKAKYNDFKEAVEMGAWLQITGGALMGGFGPDAKKLSERFLQDGLVHIVASDGHDVRRRPPVLQPAFERCVEMMGEDEARQLFFERPRAIVDDVVPADVAPPNVVLTKSRSGFFSKIFG